ncbi:MAG: dephospho-CoA kinase [Methylophilaceae bacterium]
MFRIGLTGGIGSGKSEVAKIFKSLNIPVIDLDEISKEITKKDNTGYREIIDHYGDFYLDINKELKRKKIQDDIFSSPKTKTEFESILHPIIYQKCIHKLQNYSDQDFVVIVIPLFFESNTYTKIISESLLIDCEEQVQINRVMSRDNISIELIKKIISNQMNRKEKQKKSDKIITNNTDKISELTEKVMTYYNYLLQKKLKK